MNELTSKLMNITEFMLIQIYVCMIKWTNAWTNKCMHVWSSRLNKLVKPTVHFIWGALFVWHRVSTYLVCSESVSSVRILP